MNTENWDYFFKNHPSEMRKVRSNMLYTPLVSPKQDMFCMHWDAHSEYQLKHEDRVNFEETVNYFFRREVNYLETFKDFDWAPQDLDIDFAKQKIFFKWHGETLNDVIFGGKDINKICPTWLEQLEKILSEIFYMGYVKPSFYPHCFYLDENNLMHTFDFYPVAPRKDPYIAKHLLADMIGPSSMHRFDEADHEGMINIETIFKQGMAVYIKQWPNDALKYVHNKLYVA